MTTRTISIAPVRKTVVANAPRARAFEVFTAGIDRWWPKSHVLSPSPLKMTIVEPFKGGRWHTLHEDGSDITVGHVLVWEPPARVVLSWNVNAAWQCDPNVASEVEVKFIAEGPDVTRVELEHRRFEVLGAEGGEIMRKGVDGPNGWTAILETFRKEAEA